MQKCLIFLLAFFSLSAHTLAQANWSPYVMNHERFVHLTEEQKQEVIISTMKLIVELESKYQIEVRTSGQSTEFFQKYVQLIQKLQNFLISSANADVENKSLSELAKRFAGLVEKMSTSQNTCIYGGYISITGTSNGSTYCRHPGTLSGKDEQVMDVKGAYLPGDCKGTEQISCNPVVFGYSTSKKPFCVPTSNLKVGKGHNVSQACMDKALQSKDKDAHLKVLTEAMSADKDSFNKVHGFIFQTCVCGDVKTTMNAAYAAYIKPHRTCFGMMNTLRNVYNDKCEQPDEPFKFANKWFEHFADKQNLPKSVENVRNGEFEAAYSTELNSQTFKDLCAGAPPVVPQQPSKILHCTSKCAPSSPGKFLCKVEKAYWEVTENGIKSEESIGLETLIVKELEATSATQEMTMVLADGKTKQTCDVANADVVKPSDKNCTITFESPKDDATKSVAKVTFTGYNDTDKPKVIKWEPTGTANDKDPLEMTFDRKDADQPLKVTYAIDGGAAPKEPLSCSASIPKRGEKTDDAKPDLDTEIKETTATTVKVMANVKLGEEDITAKLDKYKISWSRKTAPKTEVKKSANNTGLEEEPAEGKDKEKLEKEITDQKARIKKKEEEITKEKNEKKKPKLNLELAEENKKLEELLASKAEVIKPDATTTTTASDTDLGSENPLSAPREALAYDVCASLIDDKGAKVAGPSCKPIPPIDAAKPVNNNNNNNNNYNPGQNSRPPSFSLPVYNTRQMGIQ